MKHDIKHIGFIMDGNRRWARNRGLPTLHGHKKGYNKMKDVGDWCLERGIKTVTVYAFSTENWNRSKKEVDYLMDLLKDALTKELDEFQKRDVKLNIIGRRKELRKDIVKAIDGAQKATKNNKAAVLNIALNYGGRAEIADIVRRMAKDKKNLAKVTAEQIDKYKWTVGQPDPDIIVRTSGEHRLSGFLTWQSVYSELFFIKHHWPGFTKKDLDDIIKEYNKRTRRFGGN